MTYPGIFSNSSVENQATGDGKQNFGYTDGRPSEQFNGVFDLPNISKNVKALDQYYGRQLNMEHEFDERYFTNLNGLM